MTMTTIKSFTADDICNLGRSKEVPSILERLLTPDMEEWARRACVELASASAALRRGHITEAESTYHLVMELFHRQCDKSSIQEVHMEVEANVGLAETQLSRQRLLPDSKCEKYWTILKALGYMWQAEEVLKKLDDSGLKSRILLNSVQNKNRQIDELLKRTLKKTLLGTRTRPTRNSIYFNERGFGLYSPEKEAKSGGFPRAKSIRGRVPVTPSEEVTFLDALQKYCMTRGREDSTPKENIIRSPVIDIKTDPAKDKKIIKTNGFAEYDSDSEDKVLNIVDHIHASVLETVNSMKIRLGMGDNESTQRRPSLKDMMANYKRKSQVFEMAQEELRYGALEIAGSIRERQYVAEEAKTRHRPPLRKLHTIDNVCSHAAEHQSPVKLRRRRNSSESVQLSQMTLELNEPRIYRYSSRKLAEKEADESHFRSHEPYFISFEEVSPITEITKFSTSSSAVHSTTSNYNFMMLTLANSLANLGKDLYKSKSWEDASFFFEQALSVYCKVHMDDHVQHTVTPELLKLIGVTRCRLGNMYGGISLMQQAIDIHSSQDRAHTTEVASIWLEMGNAYLTEFKEPVRRSALVTLRNQVNREALHVDGQSDLSYESDDDDIVDEEYNIGAQEARICYEKCEELLDEVLELPDEEEDAKKQVFKVEVASRLGDCNLMIGNYDEAIGYYEAALELYASSSNCTNIEGNAHVLCMLGMAALFLGNYAKAVSIFETAVIICKPLQRRVNGNNSNAANVAFLWAIMCISYNHLQRFDKCIPLSMRCEDIFEDLYGVDFSGLKEENEAWLVCETLCVMGNACVHAQDDSAQAIHYYKLGKKVLDIGIIGDSVQQVRLLRALGEVHAGLEEHEECLECYLEALQGHEDLETENYGVCMQQSQLCSLIAQQYLSLGNNESAMEYMRKASDYQHTIHDDLYTNMITLQFELGMHALQNFQFDSAEQSFTAALHTSKQENGCLGAEVAPVLSRLATVAHVRHRLTGAHVHLYETNSYYMETLQHDCTDASSALKYANFLLHTGSSADALEYVQLALQMEVELGQEVRFEKYEELTLRAPLDLQLVDLDEADFPLVDFANYLLVACHRDLGDHEAAAECLLLLLEAQSSGPQTAYLTGAALLEYGLFFEAALSFQRNGLPAAQELASTCLLLLCAANLSTVFLVLTGIIGTKVSTC